MTLSLCSKCRDYLCALSHTDSIQIYPEFQIFHQHLLSGSSGPAEELKIRQEYHPHYCCPQERASEQSQISVVQTAMYGNQSGQ